MARADGGCCVGFQASSVTHPIPTRKVVYLVAPRLWDPRLRIHFQTMKPPTPDRDLVEPDRLRVRPGHFAWVDHRLREILHGLSLEEIALLFFLHLAADRNGCSFWADSTVARRLGLREGDVTQARCRLVARGLIAYRYPLYQLLRLPEKP